MIRWILDLIDLWRRPIGPLVLAKPAAREFLERWPHTPPDCDAWLEQHAFGDGREETYNIEQIRRLNDGR